MYRVVLGSISELCAGAIPPTLQSQAPAGARHNSWLAGRMLLNRVVSPLPGFIYGEQGKPAFPDDIALWFNLSHSGDNIVLLVSDEGEVGCDIEVIRPRINWRRLANAVFSEAEHHELEREQPQQQLDAFWRIWTRKEAIIKQRGGSAWQIVSVDSCNTASLHLSHYQSGGISLAVCTPTPFTLADDQIEIARAEK